MASRAGAETIEKSPEVLYCLKVRRCCSETKKMSLCQGDTGVNLKELPGSNVSDRITVAQYWVTTQSIKERDLSASVNQ